MNRVYLFTCLLFLISNILFAQNTADEWYRHESDSKDWKLKFKDGGQKRWKTNWFLDGLKTEVLNTRKGMIFSAGTIAGDDACHAVLWTKKSFSGDVKIEFEYTRMDTMKEQVNILYIEVTGVEPYDEDISKWRDFRTIPSMKTYFNHMNCLHISFAAFGKDGAYIRARKYPVLTGEDFNTSTEIIPAYFNTEFFLPGETYTITVIKNNYDLFFHVKGACQAELFSWNISGKAPEFGRIGLRHMYTRSSRYKNIKIYEKN